MSTPSRIKRKPLPPHLAEIAEQPRRNKAATTIQKAFRASAVRQRMTKLAAFGEQAYQKLRVYHGTHEENAEGILQKGLVPQGGSGLSGMIGHSTASQGKVFYTKDKQQAAYYARTVSGMEQIDRVAIAREADDVDAEHDARMAPPRPTIVRALLPQSVQQNAVHDDKGGDQDFTIQQKVHPQFVLPGHLDPLADVTQRRAAATLFQSELNKSGVGASFEEAALTLSRQRRKSISGDTAALDSQHATSSAELALTDYRIKKGTF